MNSRQQGFLDVPPQLLSGHDDHQLCRQLYKTASRVTLERQEVCRLERDAFENTDWSSFIGEKYISFFQSLRHTHLLISQFAPFPEHVWVFTRKAHKFALKESHIEARRVIVDKLEEKHLHGEPVLVFQMGLWDLWWKGAHGAYISDNHSKTQLNG